MAAAMAVAVVLSEEDTVVLLGRFLLIVARGRLRSGEKTHIGRMAAVELHGAQVVAEGGIRLRIGAGGAALRGQLRSHPALGSPPANIQIGTTADHPWLLLALCPRTSRHLGGGVQPRQVATGR